MRWYRTGNGNIQTSEGAFRQADPLPPKPRSLPPVPLTAWSPDDEIDIPAIAPRAHQMLAPIEDRHIGAVPLRKLGRVRLDLMPTGATPNDQPQLRFRRIANGHRRAGLRFHRRNDRGRGPGALFSPARRDAI